MKRTIISLALTSLLAACGAGSDGTNPAAPEQQEPQQQAQSVAPEQQPKIDVMKEHDQLDPMSNSVGTPFEAPKVEEEPVPEWQLKYLNMGVARAVIEYRMVGEALKAELAPEMGDGVDAWIKSDTERCIADTMPTVINEEKRAPLVKLLCTGQAYGYWALVNGVASTEGTPRQCLEKGYCGYMFREYDLSKDPLINPTDGIDSEF